MLLEDDDEARFADTQLQDIKDIVVGVGGLSEILSDVRSAFMECIPSMQETAYKTSEYFRSGQLAVAQNSFSALLEGCQWLVDTLVHVRSAGVPAAHSCFSDEKWRKVEKEFSLLIRQILLCFQRKEYPLLADLLEYDFANAMDVWLELICRKNSEESEQSELGSITATDAEQANNHDASRAYESAQEVQDSLGGR